MSVLEAFSGFIDRHFERKHILALRKHYFTLKKSMFPLMKVVYGTFDIKELNDHLVQHVGKDFEILMVHSSMNRLEPMYTGNSLALVRMLVDYCVPDITLVMPTFYFGDPNKGGAYKTFSENPQFDLLKTPSQMGMVTELFRRMKGVVHSRHPVYRISALGPLAEELIAGHESAGTPCGQGTPFDFMTTRKTMIIGIGKPFEVLTQVHHAEDIMGEDFPVPSTVGVPVRMTLVEGDKKIPHELSARSFKWKRNMWKLRSIMSSETLREWKFHHVPMFATKASDVTAALTDSARNGITLYQKT